MRPFSTRRSVVMTGRPASSIQVRLQVSRSSAVRASRMRIRSAQVALAKRVRAEVLAQPVAEPLLAEHHLELPHDDRRLLIDDRAVERAGFVEVVERAGGSHSSRRCDRPRRRPDSSVSRKRSSWLISGNDGLTIFAAMKLANTSFIQTSLNHRIVTRSPNHMCAVSCAMTLARPSCWFCVAD